MSNVPFTTQTRISDEDGDEAGCYIRFEKIGYQIVWKFTVTDGLPPEEWPVVGVELQQFYGPPGWDEVEALWPKLQGDPSIPAGYHLPTVAQQRLARRTHLLAMEPGARHPEVWELAKDGKTSERRPMILADAPDHVWVSVRLEWLRIQQEHAQRVADELEA